MADDQYALCWNNYNKNLTSGFHSLYSRGDFTDVTLSADGQLIHAHRMVLAVCSSYFRSLFDNTPATNHPIIFLKDISYKNLTDLMQFMYCGEVHVKQDDLAGFIQMAESLQIKGLTEQGVQDVDESFTSSKSTEAVSVGRSARAAKRAIKKDNDETVPAKLGKRNNVHKSSTRSSKSNDDPLQEPAGPSTSRTDFSEVSAKTEPEYDEQETDSAYLPEVSYGEDPADKDDEMNMNYENTDSFASVDNQANETTQRSDNSPEKITMKRIFYEQVAKRQQSSNCFLFSSEKYRRLIEEVRVTKSGLKKKDSRRYWLLRHYDVVMVNGKERLIVPVENAGGRLLYYVALEELFDILYENHLAIGHGGRDRMKKRLQQCYKNITLNDIQSFLNVCRVCLRKRRFDRKPLVDVSPMVFTSRDVVCPPIVEMTGKNDEAENFLTSCDVVSDDKSESTFMNCAAGSSVL